MTNIILTLTHCDSLHSQQQTETLWRVTAVAAGATFEKSWKCICVADASLAFGLYGR